MAIVLETSAAYDVGGVRLQRPYKVRRIGHFGFNAIRVPECLSFYTELCGLRVSDFNDFGPRIKDDPRSATIRDTCGYFMHHGTEHHSFVLFPKPVRDIMAPSPEGVTTNQLSWTVGSMREVFHGAAWLAAHGVHLHRTGRDMPGSNFHTYFPDADGNVNELLYGIEQIGWDGRSKPRAMHPLRLQQAPELPVISEEDENERARAQGVDMTSGLAEREKLPRVYDVDGVLLGRPFKVTRMGPVSFFVADVAAAARFYRDVIGLRVTEEIVWDGHRCVFLRANTEHHSVALYPLELRARLGLRGDTNCMAFGFQVLNYRQLRAARDFLRERGVRIVDLPQALHPGIDYAFHALDPDGHCIQVYFAMEQIGWDGIPRPAHLRPRVTPGAWPASLDDDADVYAGETFVAPLG